MAASKPKFTLADILATTQTKTGNTTIPFVQPRDFTGKPFKITDVQKAKGYRGKDVIRLTIKCKDGSEGLMDQSVTEARLNLLQAKDALVAADGWCIMVKRHLNESGTQFAWDLAEA